MARSEPSNRAEHVESDGDVCEICEQPGHDIFSCHLLKDDIPSIGSSSRTTYADANSPDLWCEDCESQGYAFACLLVYAFIDLCSSHVAADCPHSMDVF